MRAFAVAVVVVLWGAGDAAAQEGWCRGEGLIGHPSPERASFRVDLVSGRVRPARGDAPPSMAVEYPRSGRTVPWGDYTPSMDGQGMVTIVDTGTCEHTNAGCIYPWSRTRVARRESFGAGACIAFWEELGGGGVLGIERGGRQIIRMFPDVEEVTSSSTTIPSPGLEPLATIAGVLILGERRAGAPLWTVRWLGHALVLAPSRTVLRGRAERIVTSLHAGDPPIVALGDDALAGLDRRTLARRWELAADAWSLIFVDVRIVALSLERPAPDRAGVHLLVLDEAGTVLRDHVVHEGPPVSDLRMSAVDPRTFIVHVRR